MSTQLFLAYISPSFPYMKITVIGIVASFGQNTRFINCEPAGVSFRKHVWKNVSATNFCQNMYLIGIPLNLRNILQDLDVYVHHSVSFKYTKNLNIFFQASDGQIYHGCSGSIKFFSVDANISDPPVKSIFQTSLDDEGRKLIPNILWVNTFWFLKALHT